ncbi:MAG: PepSY domain-containing protein [Hoeflea sp.]|uniref:PepSY domain-containing protein n=1 Tax=Hoeflea sp. TaxID=1940281 RepID=UPI001DD8961B|nr:PepSY domain-containing protein [Hoeflea sp.]MBU4527766.1 PepSY domain-containing protein [Alphaproteobacteria bacterium]MBU4546199.1 PepSY domain-containing protein [Alphaproteobacteria bacterium]MBU4553116.1 PepSY domain-containing protein [Alphaproteobacteria bacterium]MBV1724188.1 PepSY domain-containing protein [Hoeflea sp.]MBV1759873.1 PepSY domain-containing protein [Hoeflea sp.]
MRTAAISAAILFAALTAPALADDRAPTAEEHTQIEAALTAEGFTSWGEIELDDDKVWDVDDAIHADGKEYDLELDKTTLAITDRDED